MAGVGPRIREDLVPLVERLRELEGARRAPAEPPVRGALQRREIEQQRRGLTDGARAEALDAGALRIGRYAMRRVARDDRVGERGRAQARDVAVPPARREPLAIGGS